MSSLRVYYAIGTPALTIGRIHSCSSILCRRLQHLKWRNAYRLKFHLGMPEHITYLISLAMAPPASS